MASIHEGSVHRTYVPLRWNDFDRYGHLNNAQYIDLAQEARVKFALTEFPRAGLKTPMFFLRNLEVDFMKPILPNKEDRVLIETTVEAIGTTSMTTRQEVKDPEGRVAAVVRCVSVAMDRESARPRAISSAEIGVLTQYAESSGDKGPAGELEGPDRGDREDGAR